MNTKTYFRAGTRLLQYNAVTGLYRVGNSTERECLTKDKLDAPLVQLKKQEYSRLLNVFFSTVSHSWEHDGICYRKLDNFEPTLVPPKNQPVHDAGGKMLILVYHWGRVYHFQWSYGGYPKGMLYDMRTGSFARWAQPKHCAPVFNTTNRTVA